MVCTRVSHPSPGRQTAYPAQDAFCCQMVTVRWPQGGGNWAAGWGMRPAGSRPPRSVAGGMAGDLPLLARRLQLAGSARHRGWWSRRAARSGPGARRRWSSRPGSRAAIRAGFSKAVPESPAARGRAATAIIWPRREKALSGVSTEPEGPEPGGLPARAAHHRTQVPRLALATQPAAAGPHPQRSANRLDAPSSRSGAARCSIEPVAPRSPAASRNSAR